MSVVAAPTHLQISTIVRLVMWSIGWLSAGAVLVSLAYQVPARHHVTVGRNDQGYVQGFEDAANRWGVVTDDTGATGSYRWSRPESALIFPQIGLPARATIRWRAWRPSGEAAPRVRVLLNGREELGSFTGSGNWEEHTFAIRTGLGKPRDLFLQLAVDPALDAGGVQRGVQVDRAVFETTGWPIMPYPAQVLAGSLATLLAAIRFRGRPRLAAALACGMALLFLFGYRLQVTPYPLRLLWPALIAIWLGAIIAEHVELATRTRVVDGVAAATVMVWATGMWWTSRAHVVLSVPGVEKDFRVFALRSAALGCPSGVRLAEAECVLRADEFYQLGYPFLLWLVRPITADNPFLAAQMVGLLSSLVLLVCVYLLGRLLLGPQAALLALLFVALNGWTAEYGLYLGSDMPFAAGWTLGLLAIMLVQGSRRRALIAGLCCGVAFMIRHPGILLLPLGLGLILWREHTHEARRTPATGRRRLLLASCLVLGFLLASLPQLAVNVAQTGSPLFSRQAKNIWLAVYGNTDWTRWNEASNDVSLWDIVSHEPGRFLHNWWGNIRGFWGTGSEETSEFGRALALRLLTFPANLLAVAGLLIWIMRGSLPERFLLVAGVTYLTAVSVGFLLPRFALPLVPVWGLAAAAAARWLWRGSLRRTIYGIPVRRVLVGAGIAMLLLLLGSPAAGVRMVLSHQDPDAVAAVTLIRRMVSQGDQLVVDLPPEDSLDKYSAVAHLVAVAGSTATTYVLRSDEGQGSSAGELRFVERAGRYVLYRQGP